MEDIQFAGVKNTSGEDRKVMSGGRIHLFLKDEVKVLAADLVQFLLSRNILGGDGKLVTRKFLFQSVPLTEALKHVKEPQNKSIAAAKNAAEAKEAERAEMKAEIIAEIRAKGLHAAADRVEGKK